MLIALAQIAGGFILLVWAADRLVAGAAATARNLGVSPLIIGLTIVGFGTSAPELVVSAVASYRENPGLALGNAIGSNIANLGLVLGLTAIIYPLRLESTALKREYPLLIIIMLVCFFMALNLNFSKVEGVILLLGLAALMVFLVWLGLQRTATDPLAEEFAAEIPTNIPTSKAIFWLCVGLLILPLSSSFLVEGAVTIAFNMGISDTVVGLGVLGIAAVIHPIDVAPMVLARDFPIMFLLTGMLYLIASDFRGPGKMGRSSGIAFLTIFVGYQLMVWFSAGGFSETGMG
jgi:cation:H+ antiporter